MTNSSSSILSGLLKGERNRLLLEASSVFSRAKVSLFALVSIHPVDQYQDDVFSVPATFHVLSQPCEGIWSVNLKPTTRRAVLALLLFCKTVTGSVVSQ